jgi:hypothetical protein
LRWRWRWRLHQASGLRSEGEKKQADFPHKIGNAAANDRHYPGATEDESKPSWQVFIARAE